MKTIGKIKKKHWNVYSTYEWMDLIPLGGIRADIEKQKLIITQNSSVCVYLNQYYYGLDLFKNNTIQELSNWQYLCELTGVLGVVLNINSIGDKYQLGICKFQ